MLIPTSSLLDNIFHLFLAQRTTIIRIFQTSYFFLIIALVTGWYTIVTDSSLKYIFFTFGLWCGRIAVVVFSVILIPGIAKRFGVQHKLIALIRIFRRYLGIAMFLLALTHASLIRFAPSIVFNSFFPLLPFELAGFGALVLLFPLFLTSNDRSVARLGVWWYRLHRLVYVIMWLILIHTAMQNLSLWSVIAGVTVFAEMAAIVYSRTKQFRGADQDRKVSQ